MRGFPKNVLERPTQRCKYIRYFSKPYKDDISKTIVTF